MGALAGLVFITPAAGFIDMTTAFFFGVIGAVVCRQALRFKFTKLAERMRWVDNADTFVSAACRSRAILLPDVMINGFPPKLTPLTASLMLLLLLISSLRLPS